MFKKIISKSFDSTGEIHFGRGVSALQAIFFLISFCTDLDLTP
jgi:hypothetical protein